MYVIPASSIHSALEENGKSAKRSHHPHSMIFRFKKEPRKLPQLSCTPTEPETRIDRYPRNILSHRRHCKNTSSALRYSDQFLTNTRPNGKVVDPTARREKDRVAILLPSRRATRPLGNLDLKWAKIRVGKGGGVPIREVSPGHRGSWCPFLRGAWRSGACE